MLLTLAGTELKTMSLDADLSYDLDIEMPAACEHAARKTAGPERRAEA
jgi:hypothetical protein